MMTEVVNGIQRYLQNGGYLVTYLGKYGWFDAYSHAPAKFTDDMYNKVYTLEEYWKLPKGYNDTHDWFIEGRSNLQKVEISLTEASSGLHSLGLKSQRVAVLYTPFAVQSSDTGGQHTKSYHLININQARSVSDASKTWAIHVIAHEWSHAYWWQLSKQDKANMNWFFLKYIIGDQRDAPSTYSESKAEEMFCETIATAVSEPGKLQPRFRALLQQAIAGHFERKDVDEKNPIRSQSPGVRQFSPVPGTRPQPSIATS